MKADPKGVLTGAHYVDGDVACAEGCLAAGVRFVAGYPITPSTEIVERYAARIPLVGGCFIQMEDELAASIAILGGAWGGKKVMTVTSGPGFSLMMEHIGLAIMLETPCMYVNVQRGGPSTGLPTMPGQQDMMQARWGSHGDYETIAMCPQSPQECFDLAIKGMNLAERYRLPVMFMMDECVGHMTERVVIPPAEQIDVYPRNFTEKAPAEYLPYAVEDDSLVPEMVKTGDGYRFHVTGLTHDERGYPVMNAECQKQLVSRLIDKVHKNRFEIYDYSEDETDDAEVVVVAYGIHLPRGLARHPEGPRRRDQGGLRPPGHGVALPRRADARAFRKGPGLRHARAQHGPGGPRTRACGGRQGEGVRRPPCGRHGAQPGRDLRRHQGSGRQVGRHRRARRKRRASR